MPIAPLPARAVLAVTGDDRVGFLQGLVSNDVTQAAPGHALWSALLSPQGKWLADFFINADADRLLLDVEAAQQDAVAQRLTRFRLRAKVAIAPVPLIVFAAWGADAALQPPAGSVGAADPRLSAAGARLLCPVADQLAVNATPAEYNAHRIALGLPDGSADMEADRSVLLEAGFDELNGISWSKGCYMGQELTARTRYRGLVKRRLVPISAAAAELPISGTPILLDGAEVGTLRSVQGRHGLALLRLSAIRADGLEAAGVPITPRVPVWMRLPEAAAASA